MLLIASQSFTGGAAVFRTGAFVAVAEPGESAALTLRQATSIWTVSAHMAVGSEWPHHCPAGVRWLRRIRADVVSVSATGQHTAAVPHWGPPLWQRLHGEALTLATPAERRALVDEIGEALPRGCECRAHWRRLLAEFPPIVSTAEEFFAWTVAAHNRVNRRLQKPETDLATALQKARQNPSPAASASA